MINTVTNRSFIEAEQYSSFILTQMHDGLLPGGFYRDVSDFGSGEKLNIKTIGESTIQEVEEDAPFKYSPIETGEVSLRITEYIGDAWYITDKMRQDGSQIEQLKAQRAVEATRAIQEYFETRALKTLNDGQTKGDPNRINNFAHRFVATGNNATMQLADLIYLRLAANKAELPYAGRVGMVDPIVEATLNQKFQITSGTGDLAANSTWQMITEKGFSREHDFVISLYGWDIITSNRLDRVASETINRGGAEDTDLTVTDGVANIFMCIADDNCKPLMCAWREQPSVEGGRNKDMKRDEFVQSARFGQGIQRDDSLFVVLTSETQFE